MKTFVQGRSFEIQGGAERASIDPMLLLVGESQTVFASGNLADSRMTVTRIADNLWRVQRSGWDAVGGDEGRTWNTDEEYTSITEAEWLADLQTRAEARAASTANNAPLVTYSFDAEIADDALLTPDTLAKLRDRNLFGDE